MSQTVTTTATVTFNVTHARHMAAKVAADLKRIQRFYGQPSDERISQFEAEVVELLKLGYLGEVTYGFKRDGKHIAPTLRYTAKSLETASPIDDDPGRVPVGCDTKGATFFSFLTYSAAWWKLTPTQQANIEAALPLKRGDGSAPGVDGVYVDDRTYSAGGQSLGRSTVRGNQ